jgi:SAM-dependent methyltransferase
MLAVTKERIRAAKVTFQIEDCQKTSFRNGAFDTTFMSLVIHFTEPEKTLAQMPRIPKPGGTLIIANLDPAALSAVDRFRCWARIIFNGIARFRVRPPTRGFGQHLLSENSSAHGCVKQGSECSFRQPSWMRLAPQTFRSNTSEL